MLAVLVTRLGSEPAVMDDATVRALLDEVDGHPEGCAVLTAGDWTMSVNSSWLVVVEHAEDVTVSPRHLQCADRARVRSLIQLMGLENIDLVLAGDWRPGRGPAQPRPNGPALPKNA